MCMWIAVVRELFVSMEYEVFNESSGMDRGEFVTFVTGRRDLFDKVAVTVYGRVSDKNDGFKVQCWVHNNGRFLLSGMSECCFCFADPGIFEKVASFITEYESTVGIMYATR